jgi:hypothetical protein
VIQIRAAIVRRYDPGQQTVLGTFTEVTEDLEMHQTLISGLLVFAYAILCGNDLSVRAGENRVPAEVVRALSWLPPNTQTLIVTRSAAGPGVGKAHIKNCFLAPFNITDEDPSVRPGISATDVDWQLCALCGFRDPKGIGANSSESLIITLFRKNAARVWDKVRKDADKIEQINGCSVADLGQDELKKSRGFAVRSIDCVLTMAGDSAYQWDVLARIKGKDNGRELSPAKTPEWKFATHGQGSGAFAITTRRPLASILHHRSVLALVEGPGTTMRWDSRFFCECDKSDRLTFRFLSGRSGGADAMKKWWDEGFQEYWNRELSRRFPGKSRRIDDFTVEVSVELGEDLTKDEEQEFRLIFHALLGQMAFL